MNAVGAVRTSNAIWACIHVTLCLLQASTALPFERSTLLDISIAQLGELLDSGSITSYDLVDLYFHRIKEVNDQVHAVIEVNADALAIAQELDDERQNGLARGPLHGIPILIKDNYATTDAMSTGAGSVCLARTRPGQEATVVAKLRKAGAIILGKTNLDEFSGVRGNSTSGWSPRGGQTFGAYVDHQTACGSSSGSGVAASLGLAAAALGTETSGSITCPAMVNNVVGLKPTVGLTSRYGVVPITMRQDTTGPIAQSVSDAAFLLDAIAGKDPHDNYTLAQPWDEPPSYLAALDATALQGKRLGWVWVEDDLLDAKRNVNRERIRVVFDEALADLRAAGADLIEVQLGTQNISLQDSYKTTLNNSQKYVWPDFNEAMARYFDTLIPSQNVFHNTSELLECLKATPEERGDEIGFDKWELAVASNVSAGSAEAWKNYVAASERSRDLVVNPMTKFNLDALVMQPDIAVAVASSPGLPIITVPMGALGEDAETRWDDSETVVSSGPGFPLGLSFVADRWSEQDLIGSAYAYEQISKKRHGLKPRVKPTSDLHKKLREDILELR
ncbi:amidase signature domain-containing protein [Xylariales sp. AK1849]|nr:amidase signature domain-containing protein [Xylariales sp. AK1849]